VSEMAADRSRELGLREVSLSCACHAQFNPDTTQPYTSDPDSKAADVTPLNAP